jgi:hypothetical protein
LNRSEPIDAYGAEAEEAAPMAAEAAPMAEEAASAADVAALEAESMAEEAASMAGAGAGAGAAAGASSFLPQAARAMEATREANRIDFFILFLSERFKQLPVIIEGNLP